MLFFYLRFYSLWFFFLPFLMPYSFISLSKFDSFSVKRYRMVFLLRVAFSYYLSFLFPRFNYNRVVFVFSVFCILSAMVSIQFYGSILSIPCLRFSVCLFSVRVYFSYLRVYPIFIFSLLFKFFSSSNIYKISFLLEL